jgi:hypothetical protein
MLITEQNLGQIGKLGFQKWYERQLRDSRLWLVAAFACLVLLMIGFEMFSSRERIVSFLVKALMIVFGASVAWLAFKKYSLSIRLARSVGEIAICPSCGYPSFSVVRKELAGTNNMPTRLTHDLSQDGLLVSCRRCHHKWRWGYFDNTGSDENPSLSQAPIEA